MGVNLGCPIFGIGMGFWGGFLSSFTSPSAQPGERSSTPFRRCSGKGAFARPASLVGGAVFNLREFAPSPRRRLNAASDLSPNEVEGEVAKAASCPRPATPKTERPSVSPGWRLTSRRQRGKAH